MNLTTIDGRLLKNMFVSGVNKLNQNRNYIDSLNIFPVPDGDTGTNMSLTALAAAKEVVRLVEPVDCDTVMKAVSNGSLRGARGNSGVILSQLFRGMYKAVEGKEEMTAEVLADALVKSSATAYKAVMKPKEGTILTVARQVGEKAEEMLNETDDIILLLEEVIEQCHKTVEETTNMLKPLKDAGVVDAGGKGYLMFLEGFYEGITQTAELASESGGAREQAVFTPVQLSEAEIKYGYCTEFFIQVKDCPANTLNKLKSFLQQVGDSIVVVSDEEIIKVHVHTNNPGLVLERALLIGSLSNLKIENMRLQHTNLIPFENKNQPLPPVVVQLKKEKQDFSKEVAVVAVSAGDGLTAIFKDLGVDIVIEGGQTMNPSADDFVNAIEKINKESVILLPNNKNIILAAEQAAAICKTKRVRIVPTKSVPQGITALVGCPPGKTLDELANIMKDSMDEVDTGLITKAVRDTVYEEREIHAGNYLGILNDVIQIVSEEKTQAAEKLIDRISDGKDLVSIYYGNNIAEAEAEALSRYAQENTDCEVELQYGGQPVYDYIISAE